MPEPNDLSVHDPQISEQTRFGTAGGIERVTVVRYFIGPHGPFTIELPPGEATAAAIRSRIDNQVALIRSTLG